MFCHLVYHLGLLCLWLSTVALAQRECDLDGATSTYNLGELIIPFDNLCGERRATPLGLHRPLRQAGPAVLRLRLHPLRQQHEQ
jgi:hypothetical protein